MTAVATIVAAVVFAVDRYASAGTIVESVNEVVLALAGLGVLAFVRPLAPAARFGIVAALGTLGVFLGLTKFAALTHGVVLAVVGADVARAAVVLALTAGAGAVVLATGFFLGLSEDLMRQ